MPGDSGSGIVGHVLKFVWYFIHFVGANDIVHHRQKRTVFQLCDVLQYYTTRDCRVFLQYGCYCGLGGAGTPVDVTDGCCQTHDYCYRDLKCFTAKLQSYTFHCANDTCVCQDKSGTCARDVCDCDNNLGKCLNSTTTFNKSFMNYNFTFCRHPHLAPKETTPLPLTSTAKPLASPTNQHSVTWKVGIVALSIVIPGVILAIVAVLYYHRHKGMKSGRVRELLRNAQEMSMDDYASPVSHKVQLRI